MSPFRHEKDVSGTRRQVDPYLSLGSSVGPHKSDAGSLVDPDLGRKIANNERKSPAEDGIPDGSSLFQPRPPSPLGGQCPRHDLHGRLRWWRGLGIGSDTVSGGWRWGRRWPHSEAERCLQRRLLAILRNQHEWMDIGWQDDDG